MFIFAFTPKLKSTGLYFRKKTSFLGHIILFVRINYEGLTNKCYALSIILGVTMESALQLLSPLIAITPQLCLTINI